PRFLPFTVSRIPPGLPICMVTLRWNVQVMLLPPITVSWDRYPPAGVVNSTQQSSMAVSRMTTVWLTWVGVGAGVGGAAAAADGWWLGGAAAGWPGEVTAPTARYTPYPTTRASTMIIATLQLGRRRS